MKPEEIDKLFKDGFEGYSPTPRADLWQELQNRMQPEEERKTRPMWLWYAAAACITLLLVSGVLWMQRQNQLQGPAISQVTEQPAVAHGNNPDSARQQAPYEAPAAETAPAPAEEAPAQKETSNAPAAQPAPRPAKPAVKDTKPYPSQRHLTRTFVAAADPVVKKPEMAVTPEKAAAPAPQLAANPQPQPKAEQYDTPEVTFVLNQEPVAAAAAPAGPEEATGKDSKAKRLFKQLKNLKDGQKPDLQELGIPGSYSIEVQTKFISVSKNIDF